MDELMAQFIVEARELVQAAIDDLFVLEAEPQNAERLDSAFRAVHTLKGSVGLFDLAPLQSVLHRAEDDLGKVRSGRGALDAGQIDAIVAVLEWIDACVDDIERHGEVAPDRLARAGHLEQALDADGETPKGTARPSLAEATDWARTLAATFDGEATVALRYRPLPECFFSGDDPIALMSVVPRLVLLNITPREAWAPPDRFDPFRSNLVFEALSAATPTEVEAVFRLVPDQIEIVPLALVHGHEPAHIEPGTVAADGLHSLRIDAARIDALLDTVGELMTAKNGVARLVAAARQIQGGGPLAETAAAVQKDLDRLVGTLYGQVLQARMVALAQAFKRLPRMVRDLARRLGKPVELVIEGDAIEADKAIVDDLFEPLLHLVRNALDHGIELPAERLARGKPATARLALRVIRQGDKIVISLSDDGRGIDPDVIRTAAISRHLVTTAGAAELDDRSVLEFLFAAGFSTAAAVSDLSGRGVGLDAVRAHVVRLGGTVDIDSRLGKGTTMLLRLPVSFAVTQLLVVTVAGERYGVPMQAVVETVRIDPRSVTPIRSGRAFVLRDRVAPLLSLSNLLDLPEAPTGETELTVLVLAVGENRIGIAVDAIAERVETVTRPLGGLLSGMPGIAGTTVLGDGKVLLVLDIAGLIK
ncbi:MAG: chemotaxis protein CheA [Devosia sp.]|nr:chemotaxis protein CheA [Devosia sp.]